jgi:N-acetylglucosamine-6-sulfatase
MRELRRHRLAMTLGAIGASATSLLGGAQPGAAVGSSVDSGQGVAVGPRPNIVLVLVDDMAARDLSAMPNTRRLIGRAGVTFRNSFTPFPLCCPSRVTTLTGQYAHTHGVMGNGPGDKSHPEGGYAAFPSGANTVATWLHDVGYQTALVGKYLNGYGSPGTPLRVPRGWDDWHGTLNGSYRSVEVFDGTRRRTHRVYRTDYVNRVAGNILERRIPRADPLMLFVWQQAPHDSAPIESDDPSVTLGLPVRTPVPAAVDRDFFKGTALPRSQAFNEKDVADKPRRVRGMPLLNQNYIAALREQHQQRLETLRAVDRGVKQIVHTLRSLDEFDNTVIVFTSDNGFMQGQHRIIQSKTEPYEPAIRVPLLIRGPSMPHGVVRRQLVGNMDLAPTFAEIARTRPGRVVDGVSLLPLISDAQAMLSRHLVIEMGPTKIGGTVPFWGLRTRRYVYVRRASGERELYDLVEDPMELDNLMASPGLDQGLVDRLQGELHRMRNCAGMECRPGQ